MPSETFNGQRDFWITGYYFELTSTVNPVDVTLYGKNDRVLLRASQVEEGLVHDRRGLEPFVRIEIVTGGSEAVGFMASDAVTTNRSVPSDMTDRASRQLGSLSGQAHTQSSETAAAASAEIVAANSARRYLLIQNQSASEDAYIATDGGAATADGACLKLGPGEVWEPSVPPTGAIAAIRGGASDVALHVIEA